MSVDSQVNDNTIIAYKTLALLMALQRLQSEDSRAAEEMLAYIWKNVEADIRSLTQEDAVFRAYPQAMALSHYFYYKGDFKKAIDSLTKVLNSQGIFDEQRQKDVQEMADVSVKMIRSMIRSSDK